MNEMGDTMKYVAPVAAGLGFSLEDTTAAAMLMTRAGIKGSMAGTALRSSFLKMAAPTDAGAAAMEALGVQITDSAGKMMPLGGILKQFSAGLKGMGEAEQMAALKAIVGEEAASGMMAVIAAGPDKFDEFANGLRNSTGFAGEVASKQMDNLAGSMEQLGGSVETAMIVLGKQFAPIIRVVADVITQAVNTFAAAPPWLQKLAAGALVTTAGFAGLAAGAGFLYPVVKNSIESWKLAKTALAGFSTGLKAAKAGTGPMAAGLRVASGATTGILGGFKAVGAFLMGPWGIGLAAVGALAFAVYDLWKGVNGGKSVLMPIVDKFLAWAGVGVTVKDVFTQIQQAANYVWQGIMSGVSSAKPLFADMGLAAQSLWGILQTGINFVSPLFTTVLGGALNTVKGIVQGVVGVLQMVSGLIIGIATGDFTKFTAGMNTWVGGIKTVFGGLSQIVTAPLTFIKTKLSELFTWITSNFNFGKALSTAIQNGIDSLPGPMKSIAQKIMDFLPHSPAKEGPLSEIDTVGAGLWGTIGKGIENDAGALQTSLTNVLGPFGDVFTPEVGMPAVPELPMPSFQVPNIPAPQMGAPVIPNIPAMAAPAMQAPVMPAIQAPAFQVPRIPDINAPAINVPPVNVPKVPDIQAPAMRMPAVPSWESIAPAVGDVGTPPAGRTAAMAPAAPPQVTIQMTNRFELGNGTSMPEAQKVATDIAGAVRKALDQIGNEWLGGVAVPEGA
jgi:hypothetical protein